MPKNSKEATMPTKNCIDAFNEGLADGLRCHRPTGVYKIRERRNQLSDCEEEVHRISRALRDRHARSALRHCTFQDKAHWLRGILISFAYDLGADIKPSFNALVGDGLPIEQVREIAPAVEMACNQSAEILEKARLAIAGDIRSEYQRMKSGESTIANALVQVRISLDSCISMLPKNLQTEILW